jgi:hypothetical protein
MGPLAVALGKMGYDVIKICVFYAILIVAFGLGMKN